MRGAPWATNVVSSIHAPSRAPAERTPNVLGRSPSLIFKVKKHHDGRRLNESIEYSALGRRVRPQTEFLPLRVPVPAYKISEHGAPKITTRRCIFNLPVLMKTRLILCLGQVVAEDKDLSINSAKGAGKLGGQIQLVGTRGLRT